MINVTQPFLPPRKEYEALIDGVWERNWLTNHGPLVTEFENKFKENFGLDHFHFLSNGTVALQVAYRALQLKGEVITTPFSYVATTSSLVWEHCQPVFADIHPETWCIDPARIEERITEKTSAIVATHVYGNPCDIESIEALAEKYGLKVVYDAAHCFGVKYNGKSILNFGDISTISFHATKPFHTIEGGAVVTRDPELHERMGFLRNFGHQGYEAFNGVGINGKNSEFHAAMGLCNLKYAEEILDKYRENYQTYQKYLKHTSLIFQRINESAEYNHAYMPLVFENEEILLHVRKALALKGINTRRYFYPSLNSLDYTKREKCTVAEDIAQRVLCMPMSTHIGSNEVEMISELILRQVG